jgi:nucleoid DNA-binding protein
MAQEKTTPKAMTKARVFDELAKQTGLKKQDVTKFFDALQDLIKKQLTGRNSPKVFVLPGMVKMTLKRKPAQKAGTKPNPFKKGEMMEVKAKPAENIVRVRPLKGLKELVK